MKYPVIFRVAALTLAFTTTLTAGGVDTQTQCQGKKMKAVAGGVRGAFSCKTKELKGLTLSDYDAHCIGSLSAKFGKAWGKAIGKAAKKGVSCLNAPTMDAVMTSMAGAATGASTAIRAGFSPGDDADANAVRALNKLMKASEAYLSASLAAHARNTLKPNSTKLTASLAKALKKLSKRFVSATAKAAKKGVTFTGDANAAAAAMDSVVSSIVSGMSSNPFFPVGVFVDSAVQGAEYSPGPGGGKSRTLRGGLFAITQSSMAFSIGGVGLGTATVPTSGRVTPVTLVSGAADETHPTVTNMARFLQTLDDDAKPKNGLVINSAVLAAAQGKSLDLADEGAVVTLAEQLSAFTKKGPHAAVSADSAQKHLKKELISGFAGNYEGTYSGSDSGEWKAKISKSGAIKGTGVSAEDGKFTFKGKIESSGSANFATGKTSTGASFTGSIDAAGVFSGTWEEAPGSGTFTGERIN